MTTHNQDELNKIKINFLLDVLGSWSFLLAKVHLILFVFESSLFKPKKKNLHSTHTNNPPSQPFINSHTKMITKLPSVATHTMEPLSLFLSCTNFITIHWNLYTHKQTSLWGPLKLYMHQPFFVPFVHVLKKGRHVPKLTIIHI